jgi:hypothetical protein
MKPVIILAPQLVQSFQQQVVHLLTLELDILLNFEFTPEELITYGWTSERLDRAKLVLDKMSAQMRSAGKTLPEPLTEQETGQGLISPPPTKFSLDPVGIRQRKPEFRKMSSLRLDTFPKET